MTFVKGPKGGEGARCAGTQEGAFQEKEQVQRPCGHFVPSMFENCKNYGVARDVGVWGMTWGFEPHLKTSECSAGGEGEGAEEGFA